MAWYHVNGCDCPVGCCDCGSDGAEQRLVPVYKKGILIKKTWAGDKCTGCGLKSKESICWRCSTTLDAMNEENYD